MWFVLWAAVSVCPGITDVRQMDMFRILSGILHMGNVTIEKEDRFVDKCHIAVSNHEHVWHFTVLSTCMQQSVHEFELKRLLYFVC